MMHDLPPPPYVENCGVGVNVRVDVFDAATGALLESQEIHNLVTTAGLNLLKTAMATGACAYPGWFAFGTSSTPAAAGDTALGAEVFRDVITSSAVDPSNPTLTLQYYLTSASANGNTLTEVGLFTAATLGTLYAHVILATSIPKTNLIAVSFTWTLTWAAV